MENKEFPELESQELLMEEPVLPPDMDTTADQPVVEDFFADILPNQPVTEESAFPVEPEIVNEENTEDTVDAYVAAIDEQIAAETMEQELISEEAEDTGVSAEDISLPEDTDRKSVV